MWLLDQPLLWKADGDFSRPKPPGIRICGWHGGSAYDTEIILTDVEQPKHLLTYDLGRNWCGMALAFNDVCQYVCYEKNAHQVSQSRITAPRQAARKECRVYAEQTGPQRSPEGKTRQSSTFASRHSEIRILDIRAEKDLRAEIPAEIAPLPDNHVLHRDHHLGFLHLIDVHQNQLEALDTVAVARLPGVNVRREDSARRLLQDTEPGVEPIAGQLRELFGQILAGNRAETCLMCLNHRHHREARQTGVQWLQSGAWQPNPAPPTNRNSGRGYFQPLYFRQNPNNSAVEYMPGYQVPFDRWIQNRDGTWLDLVPQSPDHSIYFQNELWLYGYTFYNGTLKLAENWHEVISVWHYQKRTSRYYGLKQHLHFLSSDTFHCRA